MGKVTIMPETIKNPYSFIGACSGVAYDSDVTDDKKNYRRGKQCVLDGHGRVLEFVDVYMVKIGRASCRERV